MVTDEEFLSKIWPQNCGDILEIIEKTKEQNKKREYLWKCKFQKYPNIILGIKSDIIRGQVNNPQIEQVEFINKLWPQNCGDILKIIEKTNIKKGGILTWRCQFIKYPCEVLTTKGHIQEGCVNNPKIEEIEFVGKIYSQQYDDLKVIKKLDNGLFECEFQKYPCKIIESKGHILRGAIDNPALPWKNGESLKRYLQENFEEKRVTLTELKDKLGITLNTICQAINKFDLNNFIDYSYKLQEKQIGEFLKEIGISFKSKHFGKELNYYELDYLISNAKLGIEYNGNYWHSEIFKNNLYHQEKTLKIKEKEGINLIHIFEYEWSYKKEILKSLIKSRLGIFDNIVYARKCTIRELQNREYQNFCNQNHLQGEAGAKVKLGLFLNDELVQIMSFSLPRFTYNFDWEIIRECSKLGYKIIGGKEKLWSYFLNKYNPQNCISYCDFSKFTGESYLNLGFKLERLNKPGFVWWDANENQVFWRSPEKHQEMKKKYFKIHDAGQLVFIWKHK